MYLACVGDAVDLVLGASTVDGAPVEVKLHQLITVILQRPALQRCRRHNIISTIQTPLYQSKYVGYRVLAKMRRKRAFLSSAILLDPYICLQDWWRERVSI